ncbi:hypothetical protein GCM10010261_61490 [Streptomyces pilosus]|uniref:hypothetical protein n=1 Tax=Streptomyces pilosus TaxID=28893 RepID=UPI001679D98C|nr:hypothetical protein [Streptomyces pilosus]GGV68080.1 hypothetical protein GCM10010261_61490 [Streptomyces pilosus]
MVLPDLHARLLADVLSVGSTHPLVITGGYAVVRARELLARPGRDLDVATGNPVPTRPATGETRGVDVLKEVFLRPVASGSYDSVRAEEGVTGTRPVPLAERGPARDVLDVFAASRRRASAVPSCVPPAAP